MHYEFKLKHSFGWSITTHQYCISEIKAQWNFGFGSFFLPISANYCAKKVFCDDEMKTQIEANPKEIVWTLSAGHTVGYRTPFSSWMMTKLGKFAKNILIERNKMQRLEICLSKNHWTVNRENSSIILGWDNTCDYFMTISKFNTIALHWDILSWLHCLL